MATVSVSFDGTNISGAESETDGGTWDKYKATQSPTQETDFVLEGTNEISNKVSNATGGIELEATTSVDYTTPRAVITKYLLSTPGLVDETVAKGMSYEVGNGVNGGTGTYEYYLYGLYAGSYPTLQNWIVFALDPNEPAWRDAVTGTPALGSIDWYGLYADITAVVKSENLVHSSLDYMTVGTGLTLVGGDGASADGTLEDFLTYDFSTNQIGICFPLPGGAAVGATVNGVLTIGTSTATVYNDSNRTLVFPAQRVSEGFSGIDIGMSNASNDINFTSYVLKGLAAPATKIFFDTSTEVDGTNDEIDITGHPFSTGDFVRYSREGGADNIGLTDNTTYFVRSVTADSLAMFAVGSTVGRQNSFTNTSRVNLTAATAPGENHSLILEVDVRPDHTVTGTTGVGNNWTACTVDGFRILTLTSKSTISGGFILNGGDIQLGGGTLSNVTISAPTTTEGAAFITTSDLADIADCTTTAGDEGHFTEIDTAGSYTYSGNTHTSYGPDRAQFHTISDVNTTTDIITTKAAHGLTTGDAVYYNNHGGPDSVGLTNNGKYYVNAQSTTTLSFHVTRSAATGDTSRVALSLGTDGEIQSIYSGKAAILNSTTATLVDSYAASNRNGGDALYSAQPGIAQSFAGAAGVLSRVRWHLRKVGSPTGNATAYLYAHSGTFGTSSVPTGSPLATSKTFDVSTLETTNYALIDFEFDDRYTMAAATNYVITIEYSGGDVSNYVEVGRDNTSPSHGGNISYNLAPWTADNTVDAIFYVYRDGEVVINISGGGDTPTYRNSGAPAGCTIVNAAVTVSFEAVDKNDTAISGVQVSAYAVDDDSEILLGDTDGTGFATGSYSGSTPRDIYYRYRKSSTGATKYKFLSGFATIASGTGVTVKRNMEEDTIADASI